MTMFAKLLNGDLDVATKLLLLAIYYVTAMLIVPMLWNWMRSASRGAWWAKMAGPNMYFLVAVGFGMLVALWFIPCV